ncbi:MAG: hypothetical protein LBN38_02135 [Verrucomicrobiota bacterium]|jgi:hypothetical protein|nr:hypothetical protein [Verrucomicrobiota bacterium]
MAKQKTVIEYLYRDASNYKAWGRLLIDGEVLKDDIAQLKRHMYDHEYFIPEEVGIPSLRMQLWQLYSKDVDDHDWHEFYKIRPATNDDEDLILWWTKKDLLDRFARIVMSG